MSLKIGQKTTIILRVIGWCILVLISIILLKTFIWEKSYYASKNRERRKIAPAVITEIGHAINPSSVSPSEQEIDNFQVAADEPRYLTIKRLGIDRAIVRSTNVNNHVLQAPENIYEAAWYSGSSRPGAGSYIILSGLDGDLTGRKGIFANLDSLEKGDQIQLTTGAGEKYLYQVQNLSIVDTTNATDKLIEVQKTINDKETLVLFTNLKTGDQHSYDSISIIQATKQ